MDILKNDKIDLGIKVKVSDIIGDILKKDDNHHNFQMLFNHLKNHLNSNSNEIELDFSILLGKVII